ncbi:alpha/beta fold hydrolase [Actinosynnema sp. NPDC050436]|uniref:alpha/beta fold hydrolase n=1 Tax=Actinosynnema sp. NPDC050436 TaxID=3155659 RepID=UPI00340E23BE
MTTPTFVFVHGSNSNSFSWGPLQRELALLGHRTLAVDLPGHGFAAAYPRAYQAPQDLAALASAPSAFAGLTQADAVQHVVDVVRRAAGHGPVLLVGHSRGGFTLTGVANAVPDLLHRVVYISAWCCVAADAAEYGRSPENATSVLGATTGVLVGDPGALGVLRMNWRTADPALLDALKLATLDDGTDAEFLAFLATLEPDEGLDAGTDRVDPVAWAGLAHTYVRLAGDRSVPPALQDRFIREADALLPGNPFDVRTLDSSHVGFLVRPAAAAELLADLASG